MFDVGGGEILVIIIAILVLFGPKKLPEIAQMFGKGMREFKKAQEEFRSQINNIQGDINTIVDDKTKATPKANPVRTFEAISTELDLDSDYIKAYKERENEDENKNASELLDKQTPEASNEKEEDIK